MPGIEHRFVETNSWQGVILEGCGRWTQQERPTDVNRLLIDFLRSL